MPGKRRPMDVNLSVLGNGTGKHWTKAEVDQRQSSEIKMPQPKALSPPGWLSASGKKLFRRYAKQLLAFPPGMVSALDAGTLGRYCDSELSYGEASAQKSFWLEVSRRRLQLLSSPDALVASGKDAQAAADAYEDAKKQVDFWSSQMVKFEKIARACASEMGMTISSRCKLIVPKSDTEPKEDPLVALQKQFLSG